MLQVQILLSTKIEINLNKILKIQRKLKLKKPNLKFLIKKVIKKEYQKGTIEIMLAHLQNDLIALKSNTTKTLITFLRLYNDKFTKKNIAFFTNFTQKNTLKIFGKKLLIYRINIIKKLPIITLNNAAYPNIRRTYTVGVALKKEKKIVAKKRKKITSQIFLKFLESRITRLICKRKYEFIVKITGCRSQYKKFIKTLLSYMGANGLRALLLEYKLSHCTPKKKRYAAIKRRLLKRLLIKNSDEL